MVCYCSAYNCTSRAIRGCGIAFHQFPRNLRKKWAIVTRRKNFTPTNHSRLCSKHFTEDCYQIIPGASYRYLKEDAIPTIFELPPHLLAPIQKKRRIIKRTQVQTGEENNGEKDGCLKIQQPSSSTSGTALVQHDRLFEPARTITEQCDAIARQNHSLEEACAYLEKSFGRDKDSNMPIIAEAWGEQLLVLEPQQRAFAEKAINDVLFEASQGTLSRHSVKINED